MRVLHRFFRVILSGVFAAALFAGVLIPTSVGAAVPSRPTASHACVTHCGVKPHLSMGQSIVNEATKWINTPYCWDGGNEKGPTHGAGNDGTEATDCGSTSIAGFDCTGLALYAIYNAGGPDLFGVAHSDAIVNYGTREPLNAMQVGDVLVFGTGPGLHVGIYAGLNSKGQQMMVDANTSYYIRPNGVYEEPVAWETSWMPITYVLRYGAVTPPPPAPVPTKVSAANHVLRVSATGAAYLVDGSGAPHWIPDALTYDCDVAAHPLWDGVTQAQVNALGNGQPWATRCSRARDAANHILVVTATNTSYWADGSGVPHWIPTTAVYECLVNKGVPVIRGLAQSQVNSLGNGKPWATCSSAPSAAAPGAGSSASPTSTTYVETVGGVAHTWTNYTNAGGTEGAAILAQESVQVSCRAAGFKVSDGDTWWYQIASSPWNYSYWVSADAFYNNGSTSGTLLGTPFFDPAVPVCGSSSGGSGSGGSGSGGGSGGGSGSPPPATTYPETVGGPSNTWTNYANAGGAEGPTIAANQTVQIACRTTGFKVSDGDTWWYQIASSPWNDAYWVSADAFYNNGSTSGTLNPAARQLTCTDS